MAKTITNNTTGSLWWNAHNSEYTITHFGSFEPGQQVSTGQNYLVTFNSEQELREYVDWNKQQDGYYDSVVYPPEEIDEEDLIE